MIDSTTTDSLAYSAELVIKAQSGDRTAKSALADHYRVAVYAIAFSRTGDREHAEDLAQEILLAALQNLDSLQDPRAFSGWLRSIALNACRQWYRRSRPWPASLSERVKALPSHDPQPMEVVLQKERQRELHKTLNLLSQANRQALLMHVWGGYSYLEIAEFTGVSVDTVAGRIHRAKSQMKQKLRARTDDLLLCPRPNQTGGR